MKKSTTAYLLSILIPLVIFTSSCTTNDLKAYQINGIPLAQSVSNTNPVGQFELGCCDSGPNELEYFGVLLFVTSPIWVPLVVIYNN